MELQDFLNKVRENESKRLKVIEIEVNGFGKVEFFRPKTSVLTKCMIDINDADTKIETDEGIITKRDMKKMIEAAKELVYNSCSLLQSKEIREMYKDLYPYDIPIEIFGMIETMNISTQIIDKFEGSKLIEELDDDIKN